MTRREGEVLKRRCKKERWIDRKRREMQRKGVDIR